MIGQRSMACYRETSKLLISPCPFIELNDTRCAARFTLGRIEQAFGVCLNQHDTCAIYFRLRREQSDATNNPRTRGEPVGLTLGGRPCTGGDEL